MKRWKEVHEWAQLQKTFRSLNVYLEMKKSLRVIYFPLKLIVRLNLLSVYVINKFFAVCRDQDPKLPNEIPL